MEKSIRAFFTKSLCQKITGLQHAVHQLSQRHHLFATNQTKLYRKIHKCLNIVFKCFSACNAQIILKCEWYKCAYTRNNLAAIFFTLFLKSRERVALLLREYLLVVDLLLHPSEQIPAIHRRRTLHRFHDSSPSIHRYSNFGPATSSDTSSVQCSVLTTS